MDRDDLLDSLLEGGDPARPIPGIASLGYRLTILQRSLPRLG